MSRAGELIVVALEVKLGHDFPLSLPVLTVSRSSVKEMGYPLNVNTEGVVCIADDAATTTNPETPGQLVKACVQRAIRVLERDPGGDEADYSAEFIAYWEGRYPGEPAVDKRVLSLVDDDTSTPTNVTYVTLLGRLGPFTAVVYDEPARFAELVSTLEAKGLRYKETPTFYLGELDLASPPFQMTNLDVVRLIEHLELGEVFTRYLKANVERPIVTFSKQVAERHLIFGWRHALLVAGRSGRYQTRKPRAKLRPRHYLQQHGRAYVERFSPQVTTQTRLVRRTAADYPASQVGSPKLLVAGLGSVGSQLTGLLAALDWDEIRLVDPDVMAVENLKRHILGISWVGRFKVDGLRALLLDKLPLGKVQVKPSGLVQTATHDPAFFNGCDYLICCTGDANAESWLDAAQQAGEITAPAFYLWVEPYLAGGHCLFINGRDGARRQDLFEAHVYKHNVIARAEHERRGFTLKEAGCQTSYTPFSNTLLTLFLTRLFPELALNMRRRDHPSCRFTWTGDLAAIEAMGIEVSDEARSLGSFGLTRVDLP